MRPAAACAGQSQRAQFRAPPLQRKTRHTTPRTRKLGIACTPTRTVQAGARSNEALVSEGVANDEPPIQIASKGGRPPLLALTSQMSPDLVAIGLVYFVQGILELATLAQTYHLKDELHAEPAQVAMFLSLAGIPWTIKPIIGFISDTVPLFGYKRRSYLLLASLAGSAAYSWMGAGPQTTTAFLAGMLLASAASAVSDVVVDSMVVERARGESQASAGSLQSLCWASFAIAQVVTASVSGTLVGECGPRAVLQLTSLFPLLVGGASLLVEEKRQASTLADSQQQQQQHSQQCEVPAANITKSANEHLQLLAKAIVRPEVAAPLAFLLFLGATPSADSAMFYYQTEYLGFTPSFLGQVQLAAACASFVAVMLYNYTLRDVPIRQLMLWGTLIAAGLQSSQLILVTGAHHALGLDDHLFVLGGSVVMNTIQNVLAMPMMVMAARMCPAGVEATMFAVIMSLTNLADGVRVGGGAALMSALGITCDDFTNLPTLLGICNAALLLPLPLLGLIPAEFDEQPQEQEQQLSTVVDSSSKETQLEGVTAGSFVSSNNRQSTPNFHLQFAYDDGSSLLSSGTRNPAAGTAMGGLIIMGDNKTSRRTTHIHHFPNPSSVASTDIRISAQHRQLRERRFKRRKFVRAGGLRPNYTDGSLHAFSSCMIGQEGDGLHAMAPEMVVVGEDGDVNVYSPATATLSRSSSAISEQELEPVAVR